METTLAESHGHDNFACACIARLGNASVEVALARRLVLNLQDVISLVRCRGARGTHLHISDLILGRALHGLVVHPDAPKQQLPTVQLSTGDLKGDRVWCLVRRAFDPDQAADRARHR